MRTEKEMFDLILNIAKNDDRIRAVYMNGSRANPNIKKDIFQDYDIVYVVEETESFINDSKWIDNFGQLIISQEPDKNDKIRGLDFDFSKSYGYLMQFTDGNRIDLHIDTIDETLSKYGEDKLTVPLLDKDNILPRIPKATDEDYWVKKPSFGEFYCTCNNFWWTVPYCAKGLWREEILYTIDIMNNCVRQGLLIMLYWQVGIETDFKISIGKSNKFLKSYVSEEIWNDLMSTFNMSNYEDAWNSLFTACKLFEQVVIKVSDKLSFEYDIEEGRRVFEFVKHIKELPKDAKEIY